MRISIEEAVRRGWIPPEEAKPVRATTTGSKTGRRAPGKREIEGEEQAQLIKMFRARFPIEGELLIHIPNGGSRRNSFEGWRLKEQGVRAGVSDLFLPVARGGFFGLWIEFKAAAPYTAPLSESQKTWIQLMKSQGYEAMVCIGIDEAFKALETYMLKPATEVA